MKSIARILKSFDDWLFRHSHYVVPTDEENNITSKPMVDSHTQREGDGNQLPPENINMRHLDVARSRTPEKCNFILPSGATICGWYLSISKMDADAIISHFEQLVNPLTGKFSNDAELIPTISDITIIDPLRTVAPDNRISRCINWSSTENEFYEPNYCNLPQGIILNPFAIIPGYGIVAYSSCKNENHAIWAQSNIAVNPLIIPFSALKVMYGSSGRNNHGSQRHRYLTNPLARINAPDASTNAPTDVIRNPQKNKRPVAKYKLNVNAPDASTNAPTDLIQKTQKINRTVGW